MRALENSAAMLAMVRGRAVEYGPSEFSIALSKAALRSISAVFVLRDLLERRGLQVVDQVDADRVAVGVVVVDARRLEDADDAPSLRAPDWATAKAVLDSEGAVVLLVDLPACAVDLAVEPAADMTGGSASGDRTPHLHRPSGVSEVEHQRMDACRQFLLGSQQREVGLLEPLAVGQPAGNGGLAYRAVAPLAAERELHQQLYCWVRAEGLS
jgi:hypothetical protein